MEAKFESTESIVKRHPNLFYSDISRVITRVNMPGGPDRVRRVCDRIMHMPTKAVKAAYDEVLHRFEGRHRNLEETFKRNYYVAVQNVPNDLPLDVSDMSEQHKLLMGAYFTKEYSIEAAAFFNPSVVLHPDQSGMDEGHCRFVLSFRAVGEGHVSSVVFRTGVADEDCNLNFDDISPYVATPKIMPNPNYDKYTFRLKISEMEVDEEVAGKVLDDLPEQFAFKDLEDAIWIFGVNNPQLSHNPTLNSIKWLARSNYQVQFPNSQKISERVIFPYSENETMGIEDARFCRFVDDDDEATYYATYTAFNGHTILPQMIETKDFLTFKVITLNGQAVRNKGMALFPRKLDGNYYMVSRIDGESLYVMKSDNIHFWNEAHILQRPRYDWDLMTIGNCGSPIETEEGWLLITHGVGPMRRYSIGAMLLDLEDPTKVISYMKEPLIEPNEKEREGYVPNVVYTCGALKHNHNILIPYAMSDSVSGFATVNMDELMGRLRKDAQG